VLLQEQSWFWQVQLYAAAPAVFAHTQHLPSQIDDTCRQQQQY
jgi:hypothetical protein